MAVAFVKSLGTSNNKTAGTTLAHTFTGATAAGNLIVARVVFDNFTTASKPIVSSIGKMAGETNNWVLLGAARSTSTSAGAFASGEMWAIQTTVAWSAAAYTTTLDSSVTMKAVLFEEFSGVTATPRSTAGTNYSTTTTAASATTTGTTPQVGDLALGFLFGSNVAAAMAGDNDTTGGAWSTPVGLGSTGSGAATNNFGIGQYTVLTAATHQTYNNQAVMTAGNGSIVAVLQQIPAPSLTQAAYRFYDEAGTESGATALANQDTAITADLNAGVGYGQLRVRLQSTTAVAVQATDDFTVQYERNASGTWINAVSEILATGYDESNETVDTTLGASLSGTITNGMAIQGNGQPLRRLGFKLSKLGTPTGTVVATVWAHTGTFGSGTGVGGVGGQLATSTTTLNPTTLTTTKAWTYFTFDGSFTLANGTNYVVGLTISGHSSSDSNNVRISTDNTSATYAGNQSAQLSGSTWTALGTSDLIFEVYTSSTAAVVGYNAANLTEGQATTLRLTGGTGTFVAGKVAEDSVVDDLGWAANNYTELVYALQINGSKLVNGDTLRFRVVRNGSTSGMTYTATPTINVVSSATFTPVVLDTLAAWLDPVDPAPFSLSGTEILTWNDKGPNAYQATASALTSAQRPNRTGTINGLTTVTFDGGDWLRTNIPATLKPFTFATVINMTAGTTDRSILGSSAAAAVGDGGWQMRASFTTDEFCLNTSNTAEVIRSTAVPEGTPTLIVLTYSATGAWTLRYNKVQVGSGTNNLTPTAARFHLIGNNSYTSVVESFTGQMGDIILCNDVLVGQDLTDLETYLDTKYFAPAGPVDLVVANATHAQVVEAPTLYPVPLLGVDAGVHVHAADNITVNYVVLAPADAAHGHTADSPTVTEASAPVNLVVQDASHSHLSQQLAEHYLLNSLSGDSCTTPDFGAMPATFVITAKVRGGPTLAQGNSGIAAQWGSSDNSWSFGRSGTTTTIGLTYSTNGTSSTLTSGAFVAAHPYRDDYMGVAYHGPLSNDTKFLRSTDYGATWPVYSMTAVAITLRESAVAVRIGNTAGQLTYQGQIFWVEMRSGTDPQGGTLLWRFDAADHVSGTTWTGAADGRTWTLSSAALITHIPAASDITVTEIPAVNLIVQDAQHSFVNQTDSIPWLVPSVSNATCPDPGNFIGDDFVFVMKAKGPLVATGALTVASQSPADPNRAWRMNRNGLSGTAAQGALQASFYPAGTVAGPPGSFNAPSSVTNNGITLDVANAQLLAYAYNKTTGAWRSMLSTDGGVTWPVVRSGTATTMAAFFDSTGPVRIGSDATGGSTVWDGTINWVEVRSGIDPLAGTLLWRFDANEHVSGTSWTDARGHVWTLTSAAALVHPTTTTPTLIETAAPTVLVVDDAFHAHSAEAPTVSVTFNLTVQDSVHTHSAEAPTLYPVPLLVVADALHTHSAANVAVDVVLVVQSAAHAHSAANVALGVDLVVQGATHAHVADNVVTNYVVLTVASAAHAHTAANVAVGVDLVVQSAAHAVSSDVPTLETAGDLIVASATHAHSANEVSLILDLVVQSAAHAHTAAPVALVVDLAVQGATHAQSAANIAVGVDLTVQSATHSHSTDNVALTQLHVLSVDSATHALASETATLYPVPDLIVAAGAHAHTAANVALVVDLVVQSSLHAHTAASVTVVVDLAVANAAHVSQCRQRGGVSDTGSPRRCRCPRPYSGKPDPRCRAGGAERRPWCRLSRSRHHPSAAGQ